MNGKKNWKMSNLVFELILSGEARRVIDILRTDNSKKKLSKAVVKCLQLMRTNLKHPSLNTHKISGIEGPNGQEVFESYVQNNTPGAYRIFWCYGPERRQIYIIDIMKHPD
jgi:hypothetical protein